MAPPAFVTQLQNLATAASGWIAGLAVPVGGAMIGLHALARHGAAHDPQKVAQHNQAMRTIGIGTVLIAVSGGLVAFLHGVF